MKLYEKEQIPLMLEALRKRAESPSALVTQTVAEVLERVHTEGDTALRRYCKQFDGVELTDLWLPEEKRQAILAKVPESVMNALRRAAKNIFAFHERQKRQSWIWNGDGKIMGQRILPLRRVGLYVPGGTAAYPSSVLMNAIPAIVAGVDEIVLATPPKSDGINPAVVAAADLVGIRRILTVGGAQAIAALAYGTDSVARVDKIVGPGNVYVATAKRLVFGTVDIDMIAGPSEVLVVADNDANPAYIAADMMSQAEHDPLASAILVCLSQEKQDAVMTELRRQLETMPRADVIKKSFDAYGFSVVVDSLEEAAALSDAVAPEHLELAVREPFALLSQVRNAGSVFLGEYAPEPLGDYYAGPNHVLPTNGTARFSSALSVDSFIKKSSYLWYNRESLEQAAGDVITLAETEGLYAHANSIKVRFDYDGK